MVHTVTLKQITSFLSVITV